MADEEAPAAHAFTRVVLTSPKGAVVFLDLLPQLQRELREQLRAPPAAAQLDALLCPLAAAIDDDVTRGDGCVILRGMPVEDEEVAIAATRALSSVIGHPVVQSADLAETVGRVEAVRTAGINTRYRGYRNTDVQQLHTDTPAPSLGIDRVFMLCVRAAHEGGATRLASAERVVSRLSPPVRELLSAPVPFLCRDEWVDAWDNGLGRRNAAPLVGADARGRVTLEYAVILRKNVEHAGAAPPGSPLASALDEVVAVANDESTFFRIKLAPGEGFIVDNRRWLHARDAFDDGPGDEGHDGDEDEATLDHATPMDGSHGSGLRARTPTSRLLLRVWMRRRVSGVGGVANYFAHMDCDDDGSSSNIVTAALAGTSSGGDATTAAVADADMATA